MKIRSLDVVESLFKVDLDSEITVLQVIQM